jgi:hypothetical protein
MQPPTLTQTGVPSLVLCGQLWTPPSRLCNDATAPALLAYRISK